jgi:hypothetical protein
MTRKFIGEILRATPIAGTLLTMERYTKEIPLVIPTAYSPSMATKSMRVIQPAIQIAYTPLAKEKYTAAIRLAIRIVC